MHLQYVASSLVNGQQEKCHLQYSVPSLESVSTSSKLWMGDIEGVGVLTWLYVYALFKDPRKHCREEDGEQRRWQHTSLIYNVTYGEAIGCFACFIDFSYHTRVNSQGIRTYSKLGGCLGLVVCHWPLKWKFQIFELLRLCPILIWSPSFHDITQTSINYSTSEKLS